MATWSSSTVRASKICIENRGNMVVSFALWNMYNNWLSPFSQPFAKGLTICLHGADIREVAADDPISPRVSVSGSWRTQVAFQSIIYDPTASEAKYSCSGELGVWYCDRESSGSQTTASPPHEVGHPGVEGAANGAWGPGMDPWRNSLVFADRICVYNRGGFVLKYDLWDGRTNRVSAIAAKDEVTDDEHNVVAGRHMCKSIADEIGNVGENDPVALRVNVLGYGDYETMVSFQTVLYRPNAGTAQYSCAGSWEDWFCDRRTHS